MMRERTFHGMQIFESAAGQLISQIFHCMPSDSSWSMLTPWNLLSFSTWTLRSLCFSTALSAFSKWLDVCLSSTEPRIWLNSAFRQSYPSFQCRVTLAALRLILIDAHTRLHRADLWVQQIYWPDFSLAAFRLLLIDVHTRLHGVDLWVQQIYWQDFLMQCEVLSA